MEAGVPELTADNLAIQAISRSDGAMKTAGSSKIGEVVATGEPAQIAEKARIEESGRLWKLLRAKGR